MFALGKRAAVALAVPFGVLLLISNAVADYRVAGVASVCSLTAGGGQSLGCDIDVKDSWAGYAGTSAAGNASKSGTTEWWGLWPPGVYGGTASYSGSLATGRMSGFASVSGPASSMGYIQLRDVLTVHLPGNQPQPIHFELDVSGSSSHANGTLLPYQGETGASAGISLVSGTRSLADTGKGFGLGAPIGATLVLDYLATPALLTFELVAVLEARINGYIDTSPSHEAIGAGVVDLSHTAYLRMTLPPGVTVTSASGVFLTQPVPLPGSLVLALSAMTSLVMFRRGRTVRPST